MALELVILGPLQVRAEGHEVVLGAAKLRSLLLRLVVDANRVVPADRLAEDLWDGDPPRSAGPTLQGYVSQLRKAIGAERVVTRAGGYELVVGPGELDAQVFEATVADARQQLAAGEAGRALEHLDQVLHAWHGAPLADAGAAAWAGSTIARLEGVRLDAIESTIEARLALGDRAGAAAAAETAIVEHPFRERLWAQLMTALYQDGRQADALRAFQRLRGLLAEELGIEPSHDLIDLERRMVVQDPSLDGGRAAPPEAASRSSGVLTFLFTDLESSTRLWEQHGEVMRSSLARHDDLVRMAVEGCDGTVVKSTGDGTIAAFSDAAGAVRAAMGIQRAVSTETWGATGPLRVRIALHTGMAEERGGDYFGPTMNRTARLLAIGHGGQVLISQSTEALVRGADDIEVLDLGEHRLRDLARHEQVFQLAVPGLPSMFPPLRSVDRPKANLPIQLTPFIGREGEVRRVHDLLAGNRAVTITGVGGVGKTRVALQVAAELVDDTTDGAWFCELAAATDEESMLATVAASVRTPPSGGSTLGERVVEHLRTKDLLLVLDNCEHLLDPVAHLADHLLRSCPSIRILATSREALDVDGERPMNLGSMTVATTDAFDAVAGCDAVKLFMDRAVSARSDFVLETSNATTIATICRRLDGIPLAIELAAVRVVSMNPSEIAGLLDERFRLLTGGRRMALERHQTLRAAVEWSYGLLDDTEQAVFERLAVFAGSFDAAAARAVVADGAVAEWDVIDALDGLVRKSLLNVEHHADGATRHQMLETLRQYARDRLDERGDADHWRRRHAMHFAALMAEISAGLAGPDEFRWRARREPELDNVRVALAWAIDLEDLDLVMSLVFGGSDEALVLWNRMGRPATRALFLIDRLEPTERITLLTLAALEAYALGDMEQASVLSRQAEALALPMGLEETHYFQRQFFSPDYTDSALRDSAVAILREHPDELDRIDMSLADRSRTYSSLASYLWQSGRDLELARQFAERSYALAIESQNPSTIAVALFSMAELEAKDSPHKALEALDRCIDLGAQGAAVSIGGALYTSSLLLARRGDWVLAWSRLREAVEILASRSRTPELDGAFGYSIEILVLGREGESAAVLIGAVLGGVLQNLRQMPVPLDRTVPDVRALRAELGAARFGACIERGSAMSYDELVSWLLHTLDGLGHGSRSILP